MVMTVPHETQSAVRLGANRRPTLIAFSLSQLAAVTVSPQAISTQNLSPNSEWYIFCIEENLSDGDSMPDGRSDSKDDQNHDLKKIFGHEGFGIMQRWGSDEEFGFASGLRDLLSRLK